MKDDSVFVGLEDFIDPRTLEFIIEFVRQKLRGYTVKSHLLFAVRVGILCFVTDAHDKTDDPYNGYDNKLDTEDQKESVEIIPGDKKVQKDYNSDYENCHDGEESPRLGKSVPVIDSGHCLCLL